MSEHDMFSPSGHPGVDTPGGRDFLTDVRDELEEIVHPHDRSLPDEIAEGLPYEMPTVPVRIKRPSRSSVNAVVLGDTNPHKLLGQDDTRHRAVIKAHATNANGSTVTVSFYSLAGGGYPLFPGEQLPIENTGDVYVTASVAGLGVAAYAERFESE